MFPSVGGVSVGLHTAFIAGRGEEIGILQRIRKKLPESSEKNMMMTICSELLDLKRIGRKAKDGNGRRLGLLVTAGLLLIRRPLKKGKPGQETQRENQKK